MFRFATCNDLIRLKCKYPDLSFPVTTWGLKMMGYLFAYDCIHDKTGKTVLEIGCGLSTDFDALFGNDMDYHMADKPGFYNEDKFQESMKRRTKTTFHPAYVGEYSPLLKESSFDIVFSISALEHVPFEKIGDVCRDMYRILKPGGKLVHTIDITTRERDERLGTTYYQELKESGFVFEDEPNIEWTWTAGKAILLEPLEVVYTYYLRKKDDLWSKPGEVSYHATTILTSATK